MKSKLLGLLSLATSIFGGLRTAETEAQSSAQEFTKSVNDLKATSNQTDTQSRLSFQNRKMGGFSNFSNVGISPKVYGMHFVKRETHKRTNI